MELIVFPIAFIYFVHLLLRDKREAKRRAALPSKEITITLTITRDDAGHIEEIRLA